MRSKKTFADEFPSLAKEWHPTKNGSLKPSDVTPKNDRKIWWLLPYDVPDDHPVKHLRGKHFDFEWQSKVNNREHGQGCPFLVGKGVWKGFNDLATTHPDVASQWHPTKNGDLTPFNITAKSGKKIWWICDKGHEWESLPANRTKGIGCPICAKEKRTSFPELAIFYYLKKIFDDAVSGETSVLKGKELDIYIPSLKVGIEYDGYMYHQDIKKDEKKNSAAKTAGIRLIRIREKGCPLFESKTSVECLFRPNNYSDRSLQDVIIELLKKLNINYYDVDIDRDSIDIYNLIEVKSKEKSLSYTHPELAKEWHPTKNRKLTPNSVTQGSNKKIWWYLPYDVPDDYPIEHLRGLHFNFEWQSTPNRRTSGAGCPFLSGKAIWQGFNDLATTHPELAIQWHPTKNGDLTPVMFSAGSDKIIWWKLPYDVPMDYPIEHLRGKHFDFEWQSSISNRTILNNDCPYLNGRALYRGYNDLATVNFELSKEWHPTRNGSLTPFDIMAGSGKKVWWLLSYDVPIDYPIKHLRGKHFDFEWEAEVYNRNYSHRGCPFLVGKAIWKGFNDLATTHPEIAAQWHPAKNGNLKPTDVTAGSNKKVWWYNKGKEWNSVICSRT